MGSYIVLVCGVLLAIGGFVGQNFGVAVFGVILIVMFAVQKSKDTQAEQEYAKNRTIPPAPPATANPSHISSLSKPFIDAVNARLADEAPAKYVSDIKRIVAKMLKDFQEQEPEKFIEFATSTDPRHWAIVRIYDIAFDIIASGEYHCMDMLTPQGKELANLCYKCLDNALTLGYIDEDTNKQQKAVLSRQIYETGKWA